MNVCIISGSARTNNNTHRVALAISKWFEPTHTTSIIDFVAYDLPFVSNGGLKYEELSAFQLNLFEQMKAAQLIIVISPEYNWSTTPELLNLLHLLPNKPFDQTLADKVYAFVGVSTGKGGKAPALHLMQIISKLISFSNMESIVSPRIFESHFTKEVLDEAGVSKGNPDYDKGLQAFCAYTEKIAERWFKDSF